MAQKIKLLNNVETYLIYFGDPFAADVRQVILCVTGNPGLPEFYIQFCERIYQETGLPVCIIGHPGHRILPHKSYQLAGHEEQFTLQAAVKHKLEFINSLPQDCEIHLIGHSIGAWMLMELLEQNPELQNRTKSINLLFPTIKHIANSDHAKFYFNKTAQKFQFLAMALCFFISVLPLQIRLFFISIYVYLYSLPKYNVEKIHNYLQPSIIEKVLFMANDEMTSVKEFHLNILGSLKKKIYVIYSKYDGWVPVKYMEELRQFEPDMKVEMVGYPHEFVLKDSVAIADLVSDFINFKCKM